MSSRRGRNEDPSAVPSRRLSVTSKHQSPKCPLLARQGAAQVAGAAVQEAIDVEIPASPE